MRRWQGILLGATRNALCGVMDGFRFCVKAYKGLKVCGGYCFPEVACMYVLALHYAGLVAPRSSFSWGPIHEQALVAALNKLTKTTRKDNQIQFPTMKCRATPLPPQPRIFITLNS